MNDIHLVETNQNQPIVEKKQSYGKVLPLLILVFIICLISLFRTLNQAQPLTSTTPSRSTLTPPIQQNLSTFQELGIQFRYPADLKVESYKNYIVINSPTSMRVSTLRPDTRIVPNFEFSFGRQSKDLQQLNNAIDIQLGQNTFKKIMIGAEGSGQYEYYVPFDTNDWLVFSMVYYDDSMIAPEDRSKKEYLTTDQKVQIMESILSSLQLDRKISKPTHMSFQCPEKTYVNCMPGPQPANPQCATDFLNWASDNCPGFEGAVY